MMGKKLLYLGLATFLSVSTLGLMNRQNVMAAPTTDVGVTYVGHVQNVGWQPWVSNGAEAGTDGKGLRVEALKVNLTNAPTGAHIDLQTHVQNIGWQTIVKDGQEAGTDGKSLRIEAIKLTLENMPGYSIQYRAQVENIGWQNWISDGQEAGTDGQSLRIEAIEIKLVKISDNSTVGVQYQGHVQNVGWQSAATNGQIAGTEGQSLRVEALKIGLVNAQAGAKINYQTHVQNIGWQTPVADSTEGGTDGKGLRIEAIKIALENLPGYSVQYRSQVQNIGWQPWVSDGQEAGTDGKGLRIEAIEVRIVKTADGSTPTPVPFINNITNVASVALNKPTDTLTVGSTDTLTATVSPSIATNKAVTWTTSDSKVVAVDNTGKVTAVSAGTATITATTADGSKTSSCIVTVNNAVVTVTSVALNKTTDALTVGSTDTLSAIVAPINATNKAVTWASSNTNVATVDNTGIVTAVSAGTATITATTADGSKTSSCIVTVNNAVVTVTSVALNKTTDALTVGSTDTLTAIVAPINATNKAVTWASSNTNVATVDNTGKVTAVSAGTATITATTADGSKTASCTINIPVVKTSGVNLNKTSDSLIVGDIDTLTTAITPSNATNQSVTWSSSNPEIATVDNTGKVTAVSAGTSTITVTTVDGSKTDSCVITVVNLSIVSINDITANLVQNDSYNLPNTVVATMNNGKTSELKISWQPNVVDTSKLGTYTFEGSVDGYNKTVKLTLNIQAYVPNLTINSYSAITINNVSQSLSLNILNNGDRSVAISKIEVYEKGVLYSTYNSSDLITNNIPTDIAAGQQWGMNINYKLGIWLDNSYIKYYIDCNGTSTQYKSNLN